ncbi:hypothetical protein M422DRAFT_52144 [Sphaerobolus stellatus SS14]|uniref:Uncharacterized protein n=1 Tax=Sphaerobolus stellatus (strain SS14) TaxID=990650 RepID=A0A0C9V9J8_SPHS4|nr:hypothetical protein M422DRAFT_52144 [Sphaerobolus stellatus SS14]
MFKVVKFLYFDSNLRMNSRTIADFALFVNRTAVKLRKILTVDGQGDSDTIDSDVRRKLDPFRNQRKIIKIFLKIDNSETDDRHETNKVEQYFAAVKYEVDKRERCRRLKIWYSTLEKSVRMCVMILSDKPVQYTDLQGRLSSTLFIQQAKLGDTGPSLPKKK